MSSLGAGEVNITIESQESKSVENAALVSKQSYYFLKLKRKRTEDATDINEVHKNNNIVAVTACKLSTECGNNCCLGQDHRLAKHFNYSLVEPFGDEILTIKGHQYSPCCGSSVVGEFTRGRKVLGKMTFSSKDNSYQVCNENGEILFVIRGPSKCSLTTCPCLMLCSRKSFNVFLLDGKQVGQIGDKWDNTVTIPIDSNNQFGVSFPHEFESTVDEKNWILMGSALVLRWQFWRPFNNSLWCLVYILICLLIFVAIAVLIDCVVFI